MIQKILSNGELGAAKAALDIAIKLKITHGGWTLRKKPGYLLQEAKASRHQNLAEINIQEAKGVVFFSIGTPKKTHSTGAIEELCAQMKRPFLHILLSETTPLQAARELGKWIQKEKITILYVDGICNQRVHKIYQQVLDIFETAFFTGAISVKIPDPFLVADLNSASPLPFAPKTVEDAVDRLLANLSTKDRKRISLTSKDDLANNESALKQHILVEFGLASGNEELMDACQAIAENVLTDAEEASQIILAELLDKILSKRK